MKGHHPLRAFSDRGCKAPGLASVARRGQMRFAYITPVKPKVLWGMSKRGVFAHLISAAASSLDGNRVRYGTRWVCGGGSDDAILLADITGRPPCAECFAEEQPTVYRIYGEGRQLLYVGYTKCFSKRLRQHERARPWWSKVVSVERESYASETEARSAEYNAILTEKPTYVGPPRSVLSTALTLVRDAG